MNLISRKGFIGAGGAFLALPLAAADEKPLWKAGIVTDTHVKRTRESCALVQAACDLFARHHIDVFANCGDIADYYYEEAEIETDQTSCKTWTMVLRQPRPLKNATGRVATPNGRSERMRYAFVFTSRHRQPAYYLLVREGGKGRIRFSRVRIERLGPEKK